MTPEQSELIAAACAYVDRQSIVASVDTWTSWNRLANAREAYGAAGGDRAGEIAEAVATEGLNRRIER